MSNWDNYFLNIANEVSKNSKCLSRKVGAIIVRDKSIISTGYNGPPRGVPECKYRYLNDTALIEELSKRGNLPKKIPDYYKERIKNNNVQCPRRELEFKSGDGLEWCVAGHGERNALINAAREGISVKDAIIYMNCNVPCTPCLIEIINAGISEIVVTELSYYDKMATYLILNSKLKVRSFNLD